MATKVIEQGASTSVFVQKVQDYKMLVKLRLTLTVVFSSVMAFLIASDGQWTWAAVGVLALGGFLVTGAANTLNQVLEKDYDKLMTRTANRPLAAGRMTVSEAVLAAGFMSLIGISLLALFNPWAAFLGTLSMVFYAFVYTPMKRISPLAVLIGAIPGALPTMIGCVAIEGQLSLLALCLFGIQFFWQFPHFWAIGWLGYEDYSKAGYKLVPMKDGKMDDKETGWQSFLCASVLLPVSILPYMIGVSGLTSAILVGLLGLGYIIMSWAFYQKPERKTALRLMFYSFGYIPFSLILLFVDKI